MNAQSIAQLGILFIGLGVAATFLMYHLWGYDYDKETRTSAAPKWAMLLHRVLGYAFAVTYVAIMWHMVPRLWEYQVEFPTRTVLHILLGFTVGFLLIIKISIMRFFRHFEEWMPFLGTAILWASVMLLALSIPFVFKERQLEQAAPGGSAFSEESIARLKTVLPSVEFPEGVKVEALATESVLQRGREILLTNCVKCHDLRTVLIKPKTPNNWYRTVVRMTDKPALFAPISPDDELAVTTYLVAITPDLQESAKKLRARKQARSEAMEATKDTLPTDIDPERAKEVYEQECSLCHDLSDVEEAPPSTKQQVTDMIQRMIDENDAEFEPASIPLIEWYMIQKFVRTSQESPN